MPNDRITEKQLNYWSEHFCWRCQKHSGSGPKYGLKLIPKCGGFICEKCYNDLFVGDKKE